MATEDLHTLKLQRYILVFIFVFNLTQNRTFKQTQIHLLPADGQDEAANNSKTSVNVWKSPNVEIR